MMMIAFQRISKNFQPVIYDNFSTRYSFNLVHIQTLESHNSNT
jgi:hypothetical protein